jgi:hypothetical protein
VKLGDWNVFFATSAGSAATLLGLLFVATQLHVEVVSDQTSRWGALAQSTLSILSIVFGLSLVFLMPGLSVQAHGEVVSFVVAIALWRVFRTWWPVFRIGEQGRWHRVAQSFWLLIAPVAAYAYLLIGGLQLVFGDSTAVLTVAAAFMSLFAIALRNSWRLVVRVQVQPR